MRFLSIETSCDETSLAVFEGKKMLSHLVASQAELHAKTGGVVPEVASRAHLEIIFPLLNETLSRAHTKLNELEAIAVTAGPGLLGALLVGVEVARTLGSVLEIPVYPINHMEGHLLANFANKEWPLPALALVVSGGHSMLVLMRGHGKYKIIGETVDDAAGEAFDKVAKLLGLGYPGGPAISRAAEDGDPKRFTFPRGMIASKNYNFSFSGLKTAVLYATAEMELTSEPNLVNDFAASFQEAVIDVLVSKTSRAIDEFYPKTLMLGGGVAANNLLRERITALAHEKKLKLSIPDFTLCTDNAAMIGLAAYYKIEEGVRPKKVFDATSSWALA